ncbi:MAG: hypothetical protein R3Y50_03520 [Rikenellaceae bacterium]
MEQKQKIKLTTTTSFVLENDEIRNLYIYLSLSQYRHLRIPQYNERLLIETLQKDFKKFYAELQAKSEEDPNNLILHKIRSFFDMHYKRLKMITDEYSEKDKTRVEELN